MSRDPQILLTDIAAACRKILRYSERKNRDEVFADELAFDGILFNFLVIGEAVKSLPDHFRHQHSDIPWREIAGMRDFVAHAYFSLDLDILWNAIRVDVPVLQARVRELLKEGPP